MWIAEWTQVERWDLPTSEGRGEGKREIVVLEYRHHNYNDDARWVLSAWVGLLLSERENERWIRLGAESSLGNGKLAVPHALRIGEAIQKKTKNNGDLFPHCLCLAQIASETFPRPDIHVLSPSFPQRHKLLSHGKKCEPYSIRKREQQIRGSMMSSSRLRGSSQTRISQGGKRFGLLSNTFFPPSPSCPVFPLFQMVTGVLNQTART